MFLQTLLLVVTISSSHGRPQSPPQGYEPPKQVFYVPQRQQYNPELQYDLPVLGPQFQIPSYNFIGDKQHFPSVQPQIVLYHGAAAPGQPFLLQPGSPPGNFLVPQGGPNVILRDAPPAPPRPVFVAGYPKPAHIPPIEKDAEEVPTNPSRIPPLRPKGENRPEKLETFNEDDTPKKTASEADVLAAADHNPAFNPKTNLRPGQRFFILNGQPLFSTYPYSNNIYPGVPNFNLKYSSFIPQTPVKKVQTYENPLLKNTKPEVISRQQPSQDYPDNLVLLNHRGSFQDGLFKSFNSAPLKQKDEQLREDEHTFGLLQLRDNDELDDDAVVIDAAQQQDDEEGGNLEEDEVVDAPADKQSEPTIAQAQPGAIALAGPGGVAAAAPRGTALVGKEGVAVSSPRATAVAGPSRNEEEEKKKRRNKIKGNSE